MNIYVIEVILGLLTGLCLGITGLAPTALTVLALEYFKIGDFKTNIGTMLFINLFPISIGSVVEFYKAKKINFLIGCILLASVIVGSWLGSKLVVGDYQMSVKTVKYLSSFIGFMIFLAFLISGYYEK